MVFKPLFQFRDAILEVGPGRTLELQLISKVQELVPAEQGLCSRVEQISVGEGSLSDTLAPNHLELKDHHFEMCLETKLAARKILLTPVRYGSTMVCQLSVPAI